MLRIFFAILFIFCAKYFIGSKVTDLTFGCNTRRYTSPGIFAGSGGSGKDTQPEWYDRYNRRNTRLEYNVRKVYPYALLAAAKINEIEEKLTHTTKESERKAIIREEYARLMKTFKTPLMKLSVTQGRILVRLIYRETNHTSFAHIREYKGAVNAYFWQSLALLFGNNLKAAYDPYGEDAEIEEIVQRIQQK